MTFDYINNTSVLRKTISTYLLALLKNNTLTDLRYLPRSVVFLIDLSIVSAAFALNNLLMRTSKVDFSMVYPFEYRIVIYTSVVALCFFIFQTHKASIRLTTIADIIKLFIALGTAYIAMLILNFVHFSLMGTYIFRYVGLIYGGITGLLCLAIFRISIKYFFLRLEAVKHKTSKRKLLMLGTDYENRAIVKNINQNLSNNTEFSGFLSFEKSSSSVKILGLNVTLCSDFYDTFKNDDEVGGIVILDSNEIDENTKIFIDFCISNKIEIFSSSMTEIMEYKENGNVLFKKAEIEDLLFRDPIEINKTQIDPFIRNRCILVTGAAGSIGSEMGRQICQFEPSTLLLLDVAETPLFYIENELKELYPMINVIGVLGNICDYKEMQGVFEQYKPEFVINAAAYKHVPMMEKYPAKAFMVNVVGTKIIADLCVRHKVVTMVQVSTDKAVNPTNIMGLSKRLAELYILSQISKMQSNGKDDVHTQFVITRFGNVLGSNGSVVPIFKRQIKERKPITITDPEMTRYFMTIPEASRLVLQSAALGKNQEIFIFDMGKPIKIIDMAHKLIRLNGLEPDVDVDIVITGKRPGEKLHEELFSENCITEPTNHSKIFKVIEKIENHKKLNGSIAHLIDAIELQDMVEVMNLAKKSVPEFGNDDIVSDNRFKS